MAADILPTNGKVLLGMFWKELSERVALATGNFAKLFGKIDIPSLPEVAARLLAAFRAEDPDMFELSKLITGDVGLSTKVLSTVNSSYYGLRHKVTSVQQAVSLLGLRQIRSLTTALRAGFLACIRSTAEPTASRTETCPSVISFANSQALSCHKFPVIICSPSTLNTWCWR